MKKKIITLMLLAFISIASVSSTYAADRRHHRSHHGHDRGRGHGHGRDGHDRR